MAGIPRVESENNAPVGGDIDGVMICQSSLQCMQAVPGPSEMFDTFGGVEIGQYQPDPLDVLWMNSTSITRFEKAPQAPMPEASNHGDGKSDK